MFKIELPPNEPQWKMEVGECANCADLRRQLEDANTLADKWRCSFRRTLGIDSKLQEQLTEARAEIERLREGWKQADKDINTHFNQSCANFRRAELAEKQLTEARAEIHRARTDST